MAIKLLRSLRLDASDGFVFDKVAEPGEWLVPGSFVFWGDDMDTLVGKRRQAFRSGFLGLSSFGWSTLAMVSEASVEEREAAIAVLAAYLRRDHGAPDEAAALAAAREELTFAESLACHPVQTIIALNRRLDSDGEIKEQFRTLRPAESTAGDGLPCSAGAFFAEEINEPEEGEAVDLAALMSAGSKVGGRQ